ncbi:MAG: ChbG/HpnK family deacetylase [Mucilaginibacter sp.]
MFNADTKKAFLKEIYWQIDKVISSQILVVHLDSHCHIHALPSFYKLFLKAAKDYRLKIRLAQTYNENNYFKFIYRKYLNNIFKEVNNNYSDCFETVSKFLTTTNS